MMTVLLGKKSQDGWAGSAGLPLQRSTLNYTYHCYTSLSMKEATKPCKKRLLKMVKK
jgi:hypothetical protein